LLKGHSKRSPVKDRCWRPIWEGKKRVLQLDAISTQYGGVPILRKVSILIEKGELVCLLGSNGAGKSTTLKAILRLVFLTEGVIRFEGEQIHQWRTHRIIEAGIRVVPEGRRLFHKMSVLENLRLGAFTEEHEEEIQSRWKGVLRLFRLKSFINSQN
jgi:branched-chain amino acid transport system ATP-binding protein